MYIHIHFAYIYIQNANITRNGKFAKSFEICIVNLCHTTCSTYSCCWLQAGGGGGEDISKHMWTFRKFPYRREVIIISPHSTRKSPKGNLADLMLSKQKLENSVSCPFWNFISTPPHRSSRLRWETVWITSGSILRN